MTKQKETSTFIPKRWAAWILVGAVSYFLLVEHRQHLFAWLPFLIIALCPLMHLFMHRGHSGHSEHRGHSGDDESADEAYRRGLEEGKNRSAQQHHKGE